MALIKCKECGTEISSKAEACPKCGAKNVKHYGCGTIIIILIVVAIFTSIFSGSNTPTPQANIQQQQEEELSEKGKSVKTKHPEWKNDVCNAVAEKKVFIGMNDHQAIAAWGPPHKVNTSTGSYGRHEQWVMHEFGGDYLYFQNGILTSMQQSK